jgi:hypothetical protein
LRNRSKIRAALGILIRTIVVTILFTLLSFAVGLFIGILASVLYGALLHIHPDMTMAYRFVAAPFAAIALVVTFFVMLINEIRRERRPLVFSPPTASRRTL